VKKRSLAREIGFALTLKAAALAALYFVFFAGSQRIGPSSSPALLSSSASPSAICS